MFDASNRIRSLPLVTTKANREQYLSSRVETASRSDRVGDVLRRVINELRANEPFGVVTVVTPTLQSAYYLRRSLASNGLFNVNFRRLEDVAEQLAANTTPGERLTDIQASEYVYQVALDETPGSRLGGERYSPQLQSALHFTFRQLERLDDHQLATLRSANSTQEELVRRFTVYRDLTSDRKYGAEVARRAARIVENDPSGSTHQVAALGKVVLVEAAPVQFELKGLFDALAARDASVVVEVEQALTERNVDKKHVHAITVPTVADEIREVTRQIVDLARDGESLTRTAVLFESDSYANRIAEALQAVGIEVSGPDRTALKDTPEGRFILGLLNVFASDFDRLDVTAWFSSSPIVDPVNGSQIPSARWDKISRSAGVVRSVKNSWTLRLDRYAKQVVNRTKQSERVNELGEGAIEAAVTESDYAVNLKRFIESLETRRYSGERTTWVEFVDWLEGLINDYFDMKSLTDDSVHERLKKLLGRLRDLDLIDVKPSIAHCIDVLREQLDRKSAGIRSLGGGVYVGPLWTAAGCPFDHVFIVGMTEGSYPTISRTDPLLPDHLKKLVDPEEERLPTRSRSIADSAMQFQSVLASAKNVRMFWPRSQPGQARQMGPARWFVSELQLLESSEFISVNELLSHQIGSLQEVGSDNVAPGNASGESELGLIGALEWVDAERVPTEFPPVVASQNLQRSLEFEARRSDSKWTEFDGKVEVEEETELSGSATAFETYAACPYRYFLSRKIRVEPTEAPEEQNTLDALTFGTLIHEILENFSNWRFKQGDRSLTAEEKEDELQKELILQIARLKDDMPGRSAGSWELESSRAWILLRQWVRRETEIAASEGVTQQHAELAFGYGEEPPVEITTESGKTIRFRGQIDRIDASEDETRVHVYDYKSGGSSSYNGLQNDPVKKGTKIQLPLYSTAARRLYPDAELGASYWFVRQPNTHERFPLPEKYREEEAVNRLHSVVEVVADGIGAGVFPANPGASRWMPGEGASYESCGYCEFKRICPDNKAQLWRAKKSSDPALADYVEMTEYSPEKSDD